MLSNLPEESFQHKERYRWYILALLTAICTFVATIQHSCLPVLFPELSDDLSLTVVQVGAIWGISNLAGVFVSIIAGLLSDRFGVKLVLSIICVLSGITGSLRGLSYNYPVLAATVLINGLFRMIIPVTATKAVGIWFKGKNLGLAMGILAMGIGLGLTLGPMISATVLSPLLGGWRNVMHFFGAISVVMAILWILFGREPHQTDSNYVGSTAVPFRQALPRVIRNKNLWLIGLLLLFRAGSIMGVAGYLPWYLREQGWEAASADGALSAFFAISTLCAIPLSYLSDRLGLRKPLVYISLVVTLVCISLIPVVQGGMIWFIILLSGIFFDGSISISMTMMLETEGIGYIYSGTALGIMFTLINAGNAALPPLGNILESINPGMPFFFWASFSILALITLFLTKETGSRGINNIIDK